MMFFVRSAHEGDLKAVSALLGRAWHATYDRFYGAAKVAELTAEWHSVAALKARLANPASEFVVADSGKAIGGMGYAAMEKPGSTIAMLHQLYVDPDHQGQGVGRDLFAELETCFPDAKVMRLQVEPRNEGAIRFYKRLGFADMGIEQECVPKGSGIAALIMEKPLDF